MEIKIYLELNSNNNTYQNLWNAKTIIWENIVLYAYRRKKGLKMFKLNAYLRKQFKTVQFF